MAIFVNGNDDNSGLAQMEFSASPVFTDTVAEPFAPIKAWTPQDGDGYKTVYARFFDNASNISEDKQVNFVYDATPPYGWVGFERYAINQQAITVTAYLGAADGYFEDEEYASPGYVGTVTDMRIGADPALANAYWQPYTDTLTFRRVVTDTAPFTLYAQFRDLAGNVSEVYSGTYTVDTLPPEIYVSVEAGETLTRTVNIYAHDDLSDLAALRLSNDPLMVEGVVTLPYTPTVTWTFDDRRVVWTQISDGVGNWTQPYPTYAAPATQGIGLASGWNLISSYRQPPAPQIPQVLADISGRYCMVLGESGGYDCTLDPVYHSLKEMYAGKGYYVKLEGEPGAGLAIPGALLPATTPLQLHPYWNWVGYLPTTALPITQALESISGHYLMVLGVDKSYDPAHPELSDLLTMEPGQAYLIRATDATDLVYPSTAGAAQSARNVQAKPTSRATPAACDGITPTPYSTLVWGSVMVAGRPAPAGTVVQAITPRGDIAGCSVVRQKARSVTCGSMVKTCQRLQSPASGIENALLSG